MNKVYIGPIGLENDPFVHWPRLDGSVHETAAAACVAAASSFTPGAFEVSRGLGRWRPGL